MFGLKNKKEVFLASPMDGQCINITEVEDQVFADKMIGDGLAIRPTSGDCVAPAAGEIVQVADTGHAIGIKTNDGLEILIHIGLETVSLSGEGFKTLVKRGDKVNIGDKLAEVDWAFIKGRDIKTTTPMVITNMDLVADIKITTGAVKAGQKVATVTLK